MNSTVFGDAGVPEGDTAGEAAAQIVMSQLLMDGVLTLQAPGRARARVWLTLSAMDEELPLRTSHKHSGCVRTTLASCVQQLEDGVEEFPVM
ncbi:unnamed protein product [Camellia sinensis]